MVINLYLNKFIKYLSEILLFIVLLFNFNEVSLKLIIDKPVCFVEFVSITLLLSLFFINLFSILAFFKLHNFIFNKLIISLKK